MHELCLTGAIFTRYTHPLVPTESGLECLTPALARAMGSQIEKCLMDHGGGLPDRHFLCSTIMDFPFANRLIDWHLLQQETHRYTQCVPDTLVNAYECASWGYCLRQALLDSHRSPYVMCTIVDLNLMNLSFWQHNTNWGDSGFGITTLLFKVSPGSEHNLIVGVAKTTNFVAEFGIAVRNCLEEKAAYKLALPFFPDKVTQLFLRLLPQADILPDLHPRLGHCFGADPWISLIEYAAQADEKQRFLATSVALNGYWAMADVSLVPDGVYAFVEA